MQNTQSMAVRVAPFVVGAVALAFAMSVAFAQTDAAAPDPTTKTVPVRLPALPDRQAGDRQGAVEKRAEVKDVRAAAKEERAAAKEVRKEKMAAAKKARAEKITQVLDTRVRQFEALIGRVESRTAKLAERGVNVAEANAQIALAKTRAAETKAAIDAVKARIAEALGSDDQRGAVALITKAAKAAHSKLLEVRAALQTAVNALKQSTASVRPATPAAPATAQ